VAGSGLHFEQAPTHHELGAEVAGQIEFRPHCIDGRGVVLTEFELRRRAGGRTRPADQDASRRAGPRPFHSPPGAHFRRTGFAGGDQRVGHGSSLTTPTAARTAGSSARATTAATVGARAANTASPAATASTGRWPRRGAGSSATDPAG